MTKPVVSVVIPVTSERAPLLERALRSVAAQRYRNIEVVIVKDGPGDGVDEVLVNQPMACPIRLVEIPKRRGPAAARNLGVKEASGDVLAFLDSDDEWFPEKTEIQMRCLENKDVCVVGSDALLMDDTTGRIKQKYVPVLQGEVFRQLACSGAGVQTSFLIVRRKCFEQVGGFNEHLSFAEEMDLELRLAKRGCRFNCVSKPLGIQHFSNCQQLSLDLSNVIKGTRLFLEIWEREMCSSFGEDGARRMRRWVFGYLVNALKRQLEGAGSFAERVRILRGMRREEWQHAGPAELVKMFVLAAFGGQAARMWRLLRWKQFGCGL